MRIEPLSKKTLESAERLARAVFPEQLPDEDTDFWLPASLDGSYRKASPWPDCIWVKYWVAVEKGKVIGITGLYKTKKDWREAYWLSWFMVDPEYRGRGIGSRLVDMMIMKARADGKKFLRLYTSPLDPVQRAAQKLYAKKGFHKTGSEYWKGKKYKVAYKELKLK